MLPSFLPCVVYYGLQKSLQRSVPREDRMNEVPSLWNMYTGWSLAHLLCYRGVPSSCSDTISQEGWQPVQIFFILYQCLRRLLSPLQNGVPCLMLGKNLIQTIQSPPDREKRHLCYLSPTSSESLSDPGMSLTLLLGKRERFLAGNDWHCNKCEKRTVSFYQH